MALLHEKTLTEAQEVFESYFHLGISLRKEGRLEESIAMLSEAVNKHPEEGVVRTELALSYMEKGDLEKAQYEFSQALHKDGLAHNYNDLGLAQFYGGHLVDAMKNLNKAIQMKGKDPNFFMNRGNVYLKQQKFTLARADFKEAVRLEPGNPKFHHAKGMTYE